MENEKIKSELAKIQNLLVSGDVSERQYEQLYAARQALAWALDNRGAKSPVATILQGKIFAPQLTEAPALNPPTASVTA
jgi:hypothetical protein